MKAIFLTEAGVSVGFGHLTRCIAISQALKEIHIPSFFIVSADNTVKTLLDGHRHLRVDWAKNQSVLMKRVALYDIIIVDSYIADRTVYTFLSTLKKVIVSIDDNNRMQYPKGIVVNGNIYAETLPYPAKKNIEYLLGTRFVALRKEFWKIPRKRIRRMIKTILITFGGEDKRHMTILALNILQPAWGNVKKNVIVGNGFSDRDDVKSAGDTNTTFHVNPSAEKIRELMLNSDLAISSGGQTTYELMRTGLPTISVIVAGNQVQNVSQLQRKGLVESGNIVSAIKKLEPYDKRKRISALQRQTIDGQGARRIAKQIASVYFRANLVIKKATKKHMHDVLHLSNEPDVRKSSLRVARIRWSDHKKWFTKLIKSKDILFLVGYVHKALVAQVRFQPENQNVFISISISDKYRGLGVGSHVLQKALEYFHRLHPETNEIFARIKPGNLISQHFFSVNGFKKKKYEGGCIIHVYCYPT